MQTAEPQRVVMPFRRALPWLLLVMTIFFLNFVSRAIFSPLMLSIEQDLGINHAQAGGFFLMVSLGYSVALAGSSFLSSRLTHRNCVILAAIWMGAGLLAVGHARSPILLQAALFFFGCSGGVYLPSGIAAITSLVREKDYGKAISVHELAPNLSLFLAPLIAEAFLRFTDWRGVMNLLGYACLAMAVIFFFIGKGGRFKGKALNLSRMTAIIRMPAFWIMGVMFCMGVGASIGPYSMLPLFLVNERGQTADFANTLLAFSRALTPVTVIIAGIASDRLGPARTIALYLALTGISTTLLALPAGGWLYAVVLIQPIFSALFFPAGFAAISMAFPPEERSVAISLIVPLGILGGMGFIPTMLGVAGDMGSFATGFILLGLLLMAAMPLLFFLSKAIRTPACPA